MRDASHTALRRTTRLSGHGRVGVLVPQLVRWPAQETLEGLAVVVQDAGLELRVTTGDERSDHGRFLARSPDRPMLDAVVVIGGCGHDAWPDPLGATVVVRAGDLDGPSPSVSLGHEGAVTEAVGHLVDLGHRRIAMLGERDAGPARPCGHRVLAYRHAVRTRGIADDPRLFADVDPADLPEVLGRLLAVTPAPTSVVVDSDELAVRVVGVLRGLGLRVPADLSVVGIGDHPVAVLADLTTVRQEPRRRGVVAGDMVAAILRGEPVDDAILPVRVVPRRSAGAPPT